MVSDGGFMEKFSLFKLVQNFFVNFACQNGGLTNKNKRRKLQISELMGQVKTQLKCHYLLGEKDFESW